MDQLSFVGRMPLVRRAATLAALVVSFVVFAGCGEDGGSADDPLGIGQTPATGAYDAATPAYDAAAAAPPLGANDAGQPDVGPAPALDAGKATPDAGGGDAARPAPEAGPSADASSGSADAGKEAGEDDWFPFPDLFPTADAAPPPARDAGAGGRDVYGPCKDLNLICFDGFDMWLNAECQTCNGGKGCLGCALPFAF